MKHETFYINAYDGVTYLRLSYINACDGHTHKTRPPHRATHLLSSYCAFSLSSCEFSSIGWRLLREIMTYPPLFWIVISLWTYMQYFILMCCYFEPICIILMCYLLLLVSLIIMIKYLIENFYMIFCLKLFIIYHKLWSNFCLLLF